MGEWKSLLKLRPFLQKHRPVLLLGIVGLLISSLITTPVPYITGRLLDKVLLGSRRLSDVFAYIAVLAGLYLASYGVSLLAKNSFVCINQTIINELRTAVMSKVMDLPMSYLSQTEKGYVQARIAECASVGSLFSPSIISMLVGVAQAIFAAITMFVVDYRLALVVVAMAPFFFFSAKSSTKNFMRSTKQTMESNALLNGECFEIMNGIEEIKVQGGKKTHLQKFKAKTDQYVQAGIKQGRTMIWFTENMGLVNSGGSLLILFIASLLILRGQFTVGLYTAFSLYSAQVFGSSSGIAALGTTLKPVCLSVERIYELLDKRGENDSRTETLNAPVVTLAFEHVSFRYRDSLPDVLRNISFELKKGERVWLRGENGSGKTTLVKLLLGLYEPTSGIITANGKNSALLNRDSLRRHIGIVSQSVFLFRGTVLDNILYGQTDKTRADVEMLIDQTGLEGYIQHFPNGLDTEISQNTAGVSGGQAQMIAFLRALLSRKDVLILDEPVSNIDAETRDLIFRILSANAYDGILLVISHQSEGLQFLDRAIDLS